MKEIRDFLKVSINNTSEKYIKRVVEYDFKGRRQKKKDISRLSGVKKRLIKTCNLLNEETNRVRDLSESV